MGLKALVHSRPWTEVQPTLTHRWQYAGEEMNEKVLHLLCMWCRALTVQENHAREKDVGAECRVTCGVEELGTCLSSLAYLQHAHWPGLLF